MAEFNDIFHKGERNLAWFVAIIMTFFFLAVIGTVILPLYTAEGWRQQPQSVKQDPNEGLPTWLAASKDQLNEEQLEKREKWELGQHVYKREGCMYCHTQQVRPLYSDIRLFSRGAVEADLQKLSSEEIKQEGNVREQIPVISSAWEYLPSQPHFLGTKRTGPDLFRVGGKYDNSWHYAHLKNPRQMVPGSIMPAFPWLFTPDGEPTEDAEALVFYLQTLGTFKEWVPRTPETQGETPTVEQPAEEQIEGDVRYEAPPRPWESPQ